MSCIVRKCKRVGGRNSNNQNAHRSLHKFPTDKILRDEWIAAVVPGRENFTPKKYHRVCSKHFATTCFTGDEKWRRLAHNAVPTLHLHFPSDDKNVKDKKIRKAITQAYADAHPEDNKCAEHFDYISKLEKKIMRLEIVAKRRLLKVKSLEKTCRILRKRNTLINSRLIEILSKEYEEAHFDKYN